MDTPNARLKEIRNHYQFNQRQMAGILDVKPSYYNDLEGVRRKISEKFAVKISEKFGANIDWLLTGKGEIGELFTKEKVYPKNVPSLSPVGNLENNAPEKGSLNADRFPHGYWGEDNFYLKMNFEKKLLLDIRDNYAEISKLYFALNDLQAFGFVLENLNRYYFNPLAKQFHSSEKYLSNGKFDYERFKNDYFKELEKLEIVKPAIIKMAAAIEEFYKEIKPFDTENVIDGFFIGGVEHKAEE